MKRKTAKTQRRRKRKKGRRNRRKKRNRWERHGRKEEGRKEMERRRERTETGELIILFVKLFGRNPQPTRNNSARGPPGFQDLSSPPKVAF